MIKKIDLKAPIVPDKGLGGLVLGSNISCLRKVFVNSYTDWQGVISDDHKSIIKTSIQRPFLGKVTFEYGRKLTIVINIFNGKICELIAKKGYKGKLWNNIAIGTSLKKLFHQLGNRNYEYDDGHLFLQDYPHLSFVLNKKLSEYEMEKKALLSRKIVEIHLRNEYASLPMDIGVLPNNLFSDNPVIETIDIEAPIIPNKSIGGLVLGNNIYSLKDVFENSHKNWKGWISDGRKSSIKAEVEPSFLDTITFEYDNKLEIFINIFNGKICTLIAKEGYKGKLWGNIGIGTSIKKLFSTLGEVRYDYSEGFLSLKGHPNLYFVIGKKWMENEIEEEVLLSRKITEIHLENEYSHIPIDLKVLPKNW